VPGLGRAIVAFPATSDSGLVTVGDVLFPVYRVVQESSIEHHGEAAMKCGVKERRDLLASHQVDLKANTKTTDTIKKPGEDHRWASESNGQ